ncbi:amino acid ABC transporter substrate-binding protein [Mucilaginibacter sp. 14171R-50]|uniref:ABC transporter substrate-binding protein n=1 Tax=Mucilaginibacter sp. 14171R-50 TaxID=2703789 RepID=UPI00138BF449|nr:penicillin-binding protein activator [Mucilaginibacter sp. 14171R-50]QHS57673.1 amino acid ABC transporter substrate-binding protein [Mucilaginibacter sp. 14171R-50]
MKKILLPVITLLAAALAFQSCKKTKKVEVVRAINIRGLFTLTGSGSTLGKTSSAAIQLAAEDVNKYLAAKGVPYSIGVNVNDTRHTADLAVAHFKQAKADGISFIIGPQSSSELAALKPLADQSKIIVISQSSTAGSLAIAGDAIFRFCPSDKIEGAASANTIYKSGKKGLVTVALDDAGNKGLQTSVGNAFTAKGGVVSAVTPYAVTTTDYSAVVADIKAKVADLSATYGADKVAVYLASFDEGVEIFKLAANEPSLAGVKWYGGDGSVLSAAFTGNAAAADFAIATGFSSPSLGLPASFAAKYQPIIDKIKEKTGLEADAFALAAYDAVWAIAYTIEANNGDISDFEKLKSSFVEQANSHQGISGSDALDEAGDRATGTFDYFGIVKSGATYNWVKVGTSED